MRNTLKIVGVLALSALVLLPAPAAAATGPFTGVVTQGQTNSHVYDNNPTKMDCIQMVTTYTVTLTYAPATDKLTLSVGTRSATGWNGYASLTVSGSVCTEFTILVTGTSVATAAAYTVTVSSGLASPGGVASA